MDYNLTTNIQSCYVEISHLVYYSHIPTAALALFLGMFVYFKNKNLISGILLSISVVFSLWVSLNLYLWLGHNSNIMMFSWSLFGILNPLLFILFAYFVYVYINKKDIDFKSKLFWIILIAPSALLTPNYITFDAINCEVSEFGLYSNYVFGLEIFVSIWIFAWSIVKYKNSNIEFRREIAVLIIGVGAFLVSFFSTIFIAEYLINNNITSSDIAYNIEQYGLFGMTFFMGMLAYMIVKFKAFNIKLLGAQALVWTVMILIVSQFAFIQNNTNRILTAITSVLVAIFGWWLVRSVKKEVEQREELEERKDQLQRMSEGLAVANDKLRVLDQAKSDFINIASHQLKKAPTPIKGFASLLLEGSYGKLTPEQEATIKKIDTANDRQILLVEDLLNVARIESGRMEFDFRPSDPVALCQDVFDNLSTAARDKGLQFSFEKPEEKISDIMMDRGKIFEAVFNFAENALKYTPAGSVKLMIRQEDGKVLISVSDTGIGIFKDDLGKLFEKFNRGKNAASSHTEGSGLGLYVVRLVIEAHGGKVWAESDGEGQGSRFIIELPAVGEIKTEEKK